MKKSSKIIGGVVTGLTIAGLAIGSVANPHAGEALCKQGEYQIDDVSIETEVGNSRQSFCLNQKDFDLLKEQLAKEIAENSKAGYGNGGFDVDPEDLWLALEIANEELKSRGVYNEEDFLLYAIERNPDETITNELLHQEIIDLFN